jgi:hypothetical protein
MTHPLDQDTPCALVREIEIPEGKDTSLSMQVSYHDSGDWMLRVLINDDKS